MVGSGAIKNQESGGNLWLGHPPSSMSSPTLRAAILVISTTASKDPSADSSSEILKDVFDKEGAGKWEVAEIKIVVDDVLEIQRSITGWTDLENSVNVIITTGGTGFAVHDTTPEVSNSALGDILVVNSYFQAITPLLHKQAPGLVHGMLAASLSVTPCRFSCNRSQPSADE